MTIAFNRIAWRRWKSISTARESSMTPFIGHFSSTGCCWVCFLSNVMAKSSTIFVLCVLLVLSWTPGSRAETRLKDLITLEGMRDNQLVGYGLVVGLAGTGDKRTTVFSTQSLANM